MTGGTIASCKLIDGEYKFVLIKSLEELDGVRGSKYVKSNPTGIYKQVKRTTYCRAKSVVSWSSLSGILYEKLYWRSVCRKIVYD